MVSVAGGGDTVSALAMANAKDDLSYVSTAGGAFLEWMEKELPGVKKLIKINKRCYYYINNELRVLKYGNRENNSCRWLLLGNAIID